MKKLITFAAASLLSTSAFAAGAWPESVDTYGNILNDEDRPAFVGTGMAEQASKEKIYGSLVGPDLEDGFRVGKAPREAGQGDQYGSILHNVGTPF